MKQRQAAFLAGAFWPGLGQLVLGRDRAGTCLSMAGLLMAAAFLTSRFSGPAALGWFLLWAGGLGDLLAVLVIGPSRRERSGRLLRAGIAYLLRNDLPRASEALDRSVSLGGGPAATLYLAEAERVQGQQGRAASRLADLAASPKAQAWRWEIARARTTHS